MSVYEALMLVFGAVTLFIAFVKLMIYIADKFSVKRK